MAIRPSHVALHVRVKLNENFKPKCLGDEYLMKDKVISIRENHVYNDAKGEYVWVGSVFNSGIAYLNEIDLEFPISDIGEAEPTKLEKKIAELENECDSIHKMLGKSAHLEKKQDDGIALQVEEMKEILSAYQWMEKSNILQEKRKLLTALKELV